MKLEPEKKQRISIIANDMDKDIEDIQRFCSQHLLDTAGAKKKMLIIGISDAEFIKDLLMGLLND